MKKSLSFENPFTNSSIDFEQDGSDISIEVIIGAPSGSETAFFYLTEDQVRALKAIIDEAANQPQGANL